MGTYLNPGMQSFEMSVNSEIYVDKTEMMTVLNALVNTNKRYVSVSRPDSSTRAARARPKGRSL